MSKATQRTRAIAHRDALHPAVRARASAAICAKLEDLPEVRSADCVFCYVPFRSEVDTLPFLHDVLVKGKRLTVPRVEGLRLMHAVQVEDLEDDLEAGHWGIPEPRQGLPVVAASEVDVMVCPGAAFDAAGHRIGYGGGYYDTFVEDVRDGVPRVAVAFEVQILDQVASERHDAAIHAVVTERRVIRPGARKAPGSPP